MHSPHTCTCAHTRCTGDAASILRGTLRLWVLQMLEGALNPDTVRVTMASDKKKWKLVTVQTSPSWGASSSESPGGRGALGVGELVPSDPGCWFGGGLLPCSPGEAAVWGRRGEGVEGAPSASSSPQCLCAARRAAAAGAGGKGTSCRAPWASWRTGPSARALRRLAGKSHLVPPV